MALAIVQKQSKCTFSSWVCSVSNLVKKTNMSKQKNYYTFIAKSASLLAEISSTFLVGKKSSWIKLVVPGDNGLVSATLSCLLWQNAYYICKQFVSRPDPTRCQAWSCSKLDTLDSIPWRCGFFFVFFCKKKRLIKKKSANNQNNMHNTYPACNVLNLHVQLSNGVSVLDLNLNYSKTCLKQPLKKKTKNWFSRLISA